MPFFLRKFFLRQRRRKGREIDPTEVMLDSSNLPNFDTDQFEGRLEKPISRLALYGAAATFAVVAIAFIIQSANLQIVHGQDYANKSERNILRPVPIFAGRGVIYDRNGIPLAWNAPNAFVGEASSTDEDTVAHREYATTTGLAHVLGYVQYPSKDKNGFYYQEDFDGVAGAEKYFNQQLSGENGSRLVEVDAKDRIVSQNVVRPPTPGENLTLSIDSRFESALYDSLRQIATQYHFAGGAGVVMDVRTGELIALTSYPEYSPQVMSDKTDVAAVRSELNNPNLPFLDRAVDGLFTPGSIIKPYVAIGVLDQHVIDPSTIIHDTGSISISNPYDSTKSTIFRDWKALGDIDFRHAIAMSSDVYFYTVGGGYKDQKGLGIANINKYLSMFGFGEAIPESFVTGPSGLLSTPAWKKTTFNEPWYIGDTYHSAIGQYGTQVTPVQVVRAVAAMANEGTLLVPAIIKDSTPQVERTIDLPKSEFDIVHQGMRLGVQVGTSVALNVPYSNFAGKSGTAELGVSKANVNSWITGFWPYENPKYAFAVTLEHGSVENLIGAAAVMRATIDKVHAIEPEYFQ
jgi:penicillin-binding protein 2